MQNKAESKTTPTGLREYSVTCEWYHIREPEKFRIFARSEDDAKEIAKLQFIGGHTKECVITGMKVGNET